MNFKNLILMLCVVLIASSHSQAKSRFDGEWSFMLSGNIFLNYGISPSMLGTADEFYKEFDATYENSKYPFCNDDLMSMNFGGQLSYRFNESPISVYCNLTTTFFETPKYYFFSGTDRVSLLIGSFTPGVEYCFGKSDELLNVLGRAGVCFSNIGGTIHYLSQKISYFGLFRIGFEFEAGGRLNIPGIPVSIELLSNYTNANLFNKSYTEPVRTPPQFMSERDLNDGAGGKINSGTKTIDYLSFKLGARLWF